MLWELSGAQNWQMLLLMWEPKKAAWREWPLSWPFQFRWMKLVQNEDTDGSCGWRFGQRQNLFGIREWWAADFCWIKVSVDENEGGDMGQDQMVEELWMPQLSYEGVGLLSCSDDLRGGVSQVLLHGPGQALCTSRLCGQVFRMVHISVGLWTNFELRHDIENRSFLL